MAKFEIAIVNVLTSEGYIRKYGKTGYVNDPRDAGGETVAGISRRNWPKSKVWPIVDLCKQDKKNFPANLLTVPELDGLIRDFYRTNFWNVIKGDDIKNQSIASLLVDKAVLEGFKPAIKRAQNLVGLESTGVVDQDLLDMLNVL